MPDEKLLVNVRRVLSAPREEVFAAWTDPVKIADWFARPPGFEIPTVEVDLRPGGSYAIHMRSPDGELDAIRGEYRDVDVPERLVYTWEWANSDEAATEVTVVFKTLGSHETEVLITHGSFVDEETRTQHAGGWDVCLNGLEGVLAGGGRADGGGG